MKKASLMSSDAAYWYNNLAYTSPTMRVVGVQPIASDFLYHCSFWRVSSIKAQTFLRLPTWDPQRCQGNCLGLFRDKLWWQHDWAVWSYGWHRESGQREVLPLSPIILDPRLIQWTERWKNQDRQKEVCLFTAHGCTMEFAPTRHGCQLRWL